MTNDFEIPNSTQTVNSKRTEVISKVAITLFSFILLGMVFILFSYDLRKKMSPSWFRTQRNILSTLRENLMADGRNILVFKVKEKGSLFLEFYSVKTEIADETSEPVEAQPPMLIQKIELSGSLDGYVNFMGQATNLAVANLDEDPYLEVIVPFYTQEFSPNLEIIKYKPESQKFEIQQNFDIPKSLIDSVSRSD